MRLDLAARVLKRIAEEGRLSLLPQLPPSISSLLHEDAEVIAAALERLPAPIRSGMAATRIETGEREGLRHDPTPAVVSESAAEAPEEEVEERDEDEEWASAGVAYEPSHEPEMRFLPRPNVFSYGPLAGDFPLVSIVSTDVNEARLELSRALPYGSFVPLTTAPAEGTDPRSAVVTVIQRGQTASQGQSAFRCLGGPHLAASGDLHPHEGPHEKLRSRIGAGLRQGNGPDRRGGDFLFRAGVFALHGDSPKDASLARGVLR